jgi:hypothetical protein
MTLRNPLQQLAPSKAPLTLVRLLLAAGILGGVLLCSLTILAGTLLSAGSRQSQSASLAALSPLKQVCFGGAGLPAAAAYSPGAEARLVVFRSNIAGSTDPTTFYNRTADYHTAWQASELEGAGLVACVHTGSVIVEECAYTLGAGGRGILQRVQWTARVDLFAAQTAELIAQGELSGALPRACQQQEEFSGTAVTQPVYGEAVTPGQIQAWLSDYVE